jgi:hypothetical protein
MELILNKLLGISSYLYAFLDFRDLIMFSISCVVVELSFIFGTELSKAFNK